MARSPTPRIGNPFGHMGLMCAVLPASQSIVRVRIKKEGGIIFADYSGYFLGNVAGACTAFT